MPLPGPAATAARQVLEAGARRFRIGGGLPTRVQALLHLVDSSQVAQRFQRAGDGGCHLATAPQLDLPPEVPVQSPRRPLQPAATQLFSRCLRTK